MNSIKIAAAIACFLMALVYSSVDEAWMWSMVLLLCAAILVAGTRSEK